MKKLLLMIACLGLSVGLPACCKKDRAEKTEKPAKQKKEKKMKKEKKGSKKSMGKDAARNDMRSMKY